jgi:hypothetical protein
VAEQIITPGWYLLFQVFRRRLTPPELTKLRACMKGDPYVMAIVTNVAPRSPEALGSPTLAHGIALSVLHLPTHQAIAKLVGRQQLDIADLPTVEFSLSRLEGLNPLGLEMEVRLWRSNRCSTRRRIGTWCSSP